MKLRQKITSFVIGILLLSIGSITILSFYQMKSLIATQVDKSMLDLADSITENYVVKEYFSGNKDISNDLLNDEIENIRRKINVEFIVIMDMNGIRHTHPQKDKIGQKFQGGDEQRVLNKGEHYISTSIGSLGPSLRAFSPIYINGKQVGAVCVGVLSSNFNQSIYKKILSFIPFIILGLIVGALGAVLISYNIKKIIFGLEPEEIALILEQKATILETIKEGIVSVDTKGNITLFNKEAAEILDLKSEDIGKPLTNFVYGSRLKDALEQGDLPENIEVKIRPGVSIISKFTPLKNKKNQSIGILINFRNLTEIKKLAEELTGIKKITWSLRAQNHEFMNRLHTIGGLIQLEEYDEALKFISRVASEKKNVSTVVTNKIKDISIAALLLAKYSGAEEARIKLTIDEDSSLKNLPQDVTSEDLVSIIGNLLDNSMDEVKNDGNGNIYVKIYEENKMLKIIVKDNGPGIRKDIRGKIYEMGVTGKKGQRGYGMYLVKNIIDDARGTINFEIKDGTTWYVSIPMIRSEEND